jgi:uroporphyrin-III C-methyltransferase
MTRTTKQNGTVYLVGAGPGDLGLVTLRAKECIENADVIVYDHLANPEMISWARDDAEIIYAGKEPGESRTQQEINALLIDKAREGKQVVRLKGGDPFVFGRGAEEAQAIADAEIAFEVVPGISSALAVPAYAGIPLTHRELASSVAVLTGARARDGARKQNLAALSADTVVILMGMAHLREIATDLITGGRAADTPAAVIRWGTYDAQQTVTGSLQTIADDAENAALRSPAVIVIGEVVNLRDRLKWFEQSFAGSQARLGDAGRPQ